MSSANTQKPGQNLPRFWETGVARQCTSGAAAGSHIQTSRPTPVVILHRAKKKSINNCLRSSTFANTLLQTEAPRSCSLCRIGLPCSTHHHKSPFSGKGGGEDAEYQRSLQKAKDFSQKRCPLCTLKIPCQHFSSHDALENARKNNVKHASRYPLPENAPYCLRFQKDGILPRYDSLGSACTGIQNLMPTAAISTLLLCLHTSM